MLPGVGALPILLRKLFQICRVVFCQVYFVGRPALVHYSLVQVLLGVISGPPPLEVFVLVSIINLELDQIQNPAP